MSDHEDRIGIEFITVLGMPPVDFIDLAGDLGVRHVSLGLTPLVLAEKLYPRWSLRDDAALYRDVAAALRDTGVAVSAGEGFFSTPRNDLADSGADLDLLRELGATRVNMVGMERDLGRAFDQCAIFAEQAAARGMTALIEFVPGLGIGDLDTARAAAAHVGRPEFAIVIDAMHLYRTGRTTEDLAALDPAFIGHAQLCDVPWVSTQPSYGYEAGHERLPPGQGELPLLDFVRALPPGRLVGIEVPQLAAAEAGVPPRDRLEACLAATRKLLSRAQLDAA